MVALATTVEEEGGGGGLLLDSSADSERKRVAITISVATRHRRGIAALLNGALPIPTGLTPVSLFLTIEVSDLRWNTRREGLFR